MAMKKFLITGGTGFIGNYLVHHLLKDGYKVRILDNNLRGIPERLKDIVQHIEIVNADIRDPQAVQDACKGVDSVCHLAYLNGTEFFYTKPELVLDIAVKGITNVIDGCIKENVKELLVASSSEVYHLASVIPTPEAVPLLIPDPLNPRYSYEGGKIITELMAINYGRKYFERTVIFRPHNVYGPDMGWEHVIPQFVMRMKQICENQKEKHIMFPIQGTGKETRAFVFIDDFINGLMLIIEKGKHLEIYNIGTTEEITIGQVAIEIGRYFGKEITIIPGKPAEGGTPRRCPDISKLVKLGYLPQVTFHDGLKVTIKWYDENIHKMPRFQKDKINETECF